MNKPHLIDDFQTAWQENPIEAITGIWHFEREPQRRSSCRSLPGHLLHLVTAGGYHLRSNGREYRIHTNNVIYYHDSEFVEWIGDETRVAFISVGFHASRLPPIPLTQRVFAASPAIRRAFHTLKDAWENRHTDPLGIFVHQALFSLIVAISKKCTDWPVASRSDTLWWQIETQLRQQTHFRPTLDELCVLAHCSRATLVRQCRAATGKSPMQQMRVMRMAEATGLLRFSSLSVSEIAEYLGYARIHEFSREFKKYHGVAPTEMRATYIHSRESYFLGLSQQEL